MASEHYLFCPKTNEAVEILRRGANGLNTPFSTKDLNKQIWSFLSYHFGKNVEFEFSDLQFKEDWFAESGVIELEERQKNERAMGGNPRAILVWNGENCEELLGREPEQLKVINGYEFGQIKLNN